jgi:5-methylcytosine-specific restriction endonuclease McrA
MIIARDQVCSGPWCDAPIRHIDHIVAWSDGGKTTITNGQGLCERCNQDKEAESWSNRTVDEPLHKVETTTPTGHTYTNTAPPPPGTPPSGTKAA